MDDKKEIKNKEPKISKELKYNKSCNKFTF